MKFGAIIEARMNSSRLPGKVIIKIKGIPTIILLIDRLKEVNKLDKIIVATTTSKKDDKLCEILKKNNVSYFRGSESNVLERVLNTAKKFKIKNIVQITGDCPLIDPEIVSQNLLIYEKNKFDYVSNSNVRSYPDGMDVAIFSTKILERAFKKTSNKYDLEHVTLFIRRNPNLFSICNILSPQSLFLPKLGLTLDEKDDFLLIKKIFNKFWKRRRDFSCLEVVNFLNKNKNFLKINSKIIRKKTPFIDK
tara:strand:- start:32506 stop:33252 length:747 start_codon:yes stop_codon:yes gene_type:complete